MTVSYNTTVGVGAAVISAIGIAGGALLGLGLSAAYGHTWQSLAEVLC